VPVTDDCGQRRRRWRHQREGTADSASCSGTYQTVMPATDAIDAP